MSAAELLAEIEGMGIRLEAQGDQLKYRAPRGSLTPDLLEALKENKAAILEALRKAGSHPETGFGACPGPEKCKGCYPIPGGRYMHPPRASQSWLDWLRQWQPKGERLQ